MAYDPTKYIRKFDRVGFSNLGEPLAVFIDPVDEVKYGLNETDIYESYLWNSRHCEPHVPSEFRLAASLQVHEQEKARAALQAMKEAYGIPIETPRCVRLIEDNVFHFPSGITSPG